MNYTEIIKNKLAEREIILPSGMTQTVVETSMELITGETLTLSHVKLESNRYSCISYVNTDFTNGILERLHYGYVDAEDSFIYIWDGSNWEIYHNGEKEL